MVLLPFFDIPSGFQLGKITEECPFQGPVFFDWVDDIVKIFGVWEKFTVSHSRLCCIPYFTLYKLVSLRNSLNRISSLWLRPCPSSVTSSVLFIHGWHPWMKISSIENFDGWQLHPWMKKFHPWMKKFYPWMKRFHP